MLSFNVKPQPKPLYSEDKVPYLSLLKSNLVHLPYFHTQSDA